MPKKSKKNPNELADAYKERLAHAVNNSDKWIRKVLKMSLSKKYPTTDDDKRKIVAYIGTAFDEMSTRITGTSEETTESFKL